MDGERHSSPSGRYDTRTRLGLQLEFGQPIDGPFCSSTRPGTARTSSGASTDRSSGPWRPSGPAPSAAPLRRAPRRVLRRCGSRPTRSARGGTDRIPRRRLQRQGGAARATRRPRRLRRPRTRLSQRRLERPGRVAQKKPPRPRCRTPAEGTLGTRPPPCRRMVAPMRPPLIPCARSQPPGRRRRPRSSPLLPVWTSAPSRKRLQTFSPLRRAPPADRRRFPKRPRLVRASGSRARRRRRRRPPAGPVPWYSGC